MVPIYVQPRPQVPSPEQRFRAYLLAKAQQWSGTEPPDVWAVAKYVRSIGADGLAAEFRQDTADVCAFVQNRGNQAVADTVIDVLGLLDPAVAGAADIITGALRILCGLRPSWLARHGWWSIPAAGVTIIGGIVALVERGKRGRPRR